jgi:hypothetical protein
MFSEATDALAVLSAYDYAMMEAKLMVGWMDLERVQRFMQSRFIKPTTVTGAPVVAPSVPPPPFGTPAVSSGAVSHAASTAADLPHHAAGFSAQVLAGRNPPSYAVQTEATRASDSAPDCLYFVLGSCRSKGKCSRIHRRVHIASSAGSGAPICKHFLKPGGCTSGAGCAFRHFVLLP